MNHAVAVKGVIRRFAEYMHRIGSYAQKVSSQILRNLANDFHVNGITLLGHGTEVTIEEKVG